METQELEIGAFYDVVHSRKGKFCIKLTHIGDPFVKGIVAEGKAAAMMPYNEKFEGEEIEVRRSFCTFTKRPQL